MSQPTLITESPLNQILIDASKELRYMYSEQTDEYGLLMFKPGFSSSDYNLAFYLKTDELLNTRGLHLDTFSASERLDFQRARGVAGYK